MKITESKVLVLDTETTGTDVSTDRVVEIGGVLITAGVVGEPFGTILDPGIPIPPEASQVHGIWPGAVAGGQRFEAIAPRLMARVEAADLLCGFNAVAFDIPLLQAELGRCGVAFAAGAAEKLGQRPIIDPLIWLRRRNWDKARNLGAVTERYGIPLGGGVHTAIGDAVVTAKLLLDLIRRGVVADDLDLAIKVQERWRKVMADERAKWGHWLYCDFMADFADAPPRLAFGKSRGVLLTECEAGLLDWALGLRDMHAGARAAFQAERDRRRR